jgi:RimJ/RimL family protein N-acetyltransferase
MVRGFSTFSGGHLQLTVEEDESCELGYWLGFEYWGRDYATDACNAQA